MFLEDTDLVLEFTNESSIDQINVIDPNGELFDELSIVSGVSRDSIAIGTDYDPGVYEIIALEDGDEQSTQSVTIESDIRITDLRLGRNHPDEMFEGASDREVRTETIITLKNQGSGPDAATHLAFSGDVPRQTPSRDEYDESGIYDEESDLGSYADTIDLPPGERVTIYSQRRPFSAASERVSCTPETEHGVFEVAVETAMLDDAVSEDYEVTYTGEDLVECDIEIEVE
ncbi:hypothetical protein B2G88_18080 [Natronolimnobius baerhuensis]|uniref:Uncharacterized protein n=1 Tax=Natronolimnobius baerhuensis TaxID=253108 RepID=A0A202E457_9EURY|nr:hypothetical protein B2G88_18080 [Natronolimnobius baerhuensis]